MSFGSSNISVVCVCVCPRVCAQAFCPAETHVFSPQKGTEMSPDSDAFQAAKIPVENCVRVSL